MEVDILEADNLQMRNVKVSNVNDVCIDENDSDSEQLEDSLININQHSDSQEECDNEILQDLTVLSNVTGTLEF